MRWLDGIIDSMDMGLGWTPEVGDGQGGLACCGLWGRKESDLTEQRTDDYPDKILVFGNGKLIPLIVFYSNCFSFFQHIFSII